MNDVDASAVMITLPPLAAYARVARAAAVACASLASFDVDDLVDVRLLVDEVFHALMAMGEGPITLLLHPAEGHLGVTMRSNAGGPAHWSDAEFDLVRRVIDVVTVTAAIGSADGTAWFEAELQALQLS